MQNTYCAIIQARLGSSRLPLKSLVALHGIPIIDWVVNRVSTAKRLNKVLVAIPATDLDQALGAHLTMRGIPYVAGSENDVLNRFYQAAKAVQARHIIRICADNPLIWGEAIDRLIDYYEQTQPDYAYNHIPKGNRWPDGLGAEICSFALLEAMENKAKDASEREHCMNYIWNHADSFSIKTFDPEEPWLCRPDIKLDIDTVEDYNRLAHCPLSIDIPIRQLIDCFPKQS
ncbi:MAG: NTP transferase domain-containing protein [Desulfovibrio sp.]|nr:NTP transferase domain-containing protein [Desulfovibrio sp.]